MGARPGGNPAHVGRRRWQRYRTSRVQSPKLDPRVRPQKIILTQPVAVGRRAENVNAIFWTVISWLWYFNPLSDDKLKFR
jgi:hypothetical protein